SGVGEAHEACVGDQLEAQPDPALLAGPAGIGAARRAVGRTLVVRVAEAAVAAHHEHRALAGLHEVEQHGLMVLVEHLGPDGNAQHQGLARRAGAVAPRAAAAVLRGEMLLVAAVDESVEVGGGPEHAVAAAAPVAAVGAAELDELLPPEARRARAAVAAP